MQILIVYATNEGQTAKVANRIKEKLEAQHEVTIADVEKDQPDINGFELILIGASVHVGAYQKTIRNYITKNADALNRKKSAFFSVSLTAANQGKKERKKIEDDTKAMLYAAKWNPEKVEFFAGALKYTKYNFLKRWMMKMIASSQGGDTDTSKDHEYTDWKAVEDFAGLVTA